MFLGESYQISPQWALVDSKVADNFIDAGMAQALAILVQPKIVPELMETIDGSLL